jgi:hypothetical protein
MSPPLEAQVLASMAPNTNVPSLQRADAPTGAWTETADARAGVD